MCGVIKPAHHNNAIMDDDVADGTIVSTYEGEGTGTCRMGNDVPNHTTMNHGHDQLVRMIGSDIVQTPKDSLMKNVHGFSTRDDIPALLLHHPNKYRIMFCRLDPEGPAFPIAEVYLV